MLVAFEKMEALRWLPFISRDGMLIVNNQEIFPMPVILGRAEYPFQLEKTLSETVPRCVVVEAAKEAEEIGDPRVMNMVLLGAVVKKLGLVGISWEETLKACVPPAAFRVNLLAFEKGMDLAG